MGLRVFVVALLALPFMVVALVPNTGVGAVTFDDCVANAASDAEAQRCIDQNSVCTLQRSVFLGLPTWYKYLEVELDETGRCSPVLSGSDTEQRVNSALPIALAVLEGLLRLSGVVAVVMIFVSGFRFILSQGNPDKAAAARKTAINSLVGLVIVTLAVSLVSFVGGQLN